MNRSLLSALAVAGMIALPLAQPAQAAVTTTSDLVVVTDNGGGSFSFTSAGWLGGGTVTGSFAGNDDVLFPDGILSSFEGEVTAFSASYSGGTIVGPLSWAFEDLFGLVYHLNGGPLGDDLGFFDEGIGAITDSTLFVIGPGPVGICGIEATCGVIELVSETPVLPLMLAGLALLAAVLRRPSPSLSRSPAMTKGRKKAAAAAAFAVALSIPAITRADIVINAVETGGDVVFSYSGSIDVSGLGAPQLDLLLTHIRPDLGTLVWGGVTDVYSGLPVFPVFGTGGVSFVDSRTGDQFATIGPNLGLPEGYETGDPISGTLTFDTETFASLGLTPGTYVLQLPDDTITLTIGVAQVPEPVTLALFAIVASALP